MIFKINILNLDHIDATHFANSVIHILLLDFKDQLLKHLSFEDSEYITKRDYDKI